MPTEIRTKARSNAIFSSINLFTLLTDGVGILLYAAKAFYGMKYIKSSVFPPKMEYEYQYEGYVGKYRWRIKKVKLMRAALVKYFYISANALIFYLFMSIMLIIGFWTNKDTWWRCCSLIALCLW